LIEIDIAPFHSGKQRINFFLCEYLIGHRAIIY
jgi:hypothetical protein